MTHESARHTSRVESDVSVANSRREEESKRANVLILRRDDKRYSH